MSRPLDPEAQPLLNISPKSAEEYMKNEVRVGFVCKVYGILSAQLFTTVLISAPLASQTVQWTLDNQWVLYVSLAALLICSCLMICAGQETMRRFPENYIFLFVYTALLSVCVGFVSAAYTWQSVVLAAGVSLVIFVLLTGYAFYATTDFTGLGPYLFAFLSVLIVFSLVLSVLALCGVEIEWMTILLDVLVVVLFCFFIIYEMTILLDVLVVVLFCFFIIYDTQCMMGDWGGHQVKISIDDYVFAALNLYLDVINIFLAILSLFGERK